MDNVIKDKLSNASKDKLMILSGKVKTVSNSACWCTGIVYTLWQIRKIVEKGCCVS